MTRHGVMQLWWLHHTLRSGGYRDPSRLAWVRTSPTSAAALMAAVGCNGVAARCSRDGSRGP